MGLADRRRVVLWAWSPLVVMELGLERRTSMRSASRCSSAALFAWQRGRAATAGALVAAAAAAKLLPIVALAGMRRRRALAAAAIVAVVLALPYVAAGPRLSGSLGEYSRRWRVNDGAFALLYVAAEGVVAHTRFAGRYDLVRFAAAGAPGDGARSRHRSFPMRSPASSRGCRPGAIFLAVVAWALWRRASAVRLTEAAIGAFVLLTPALHPWYVLWLLAARRRRWLAGVAGAGAAGAARLSPARRVARGRSMARPGVDTRARTWADARRASH